MPIYKKNNKYYAKVNFKNHEGKYKSIQSKYFDTKREAQEEEIVLRQKLNVGENNITTFEEAYNEYLSYKKSKDVSQSTIRVYEYYFLKIGELKNKKIKDISQTDIASLKLKLESENYTRIDLVLAFVKSVITRASKKHKIIINDLDISTYLKKPNKRLNFYTKEEFEKFIANVENHTYKTLFTLLFYNGLRVSEARALKFSDVKNNTIEIDKQYYHKVGETNRLKTKNSYRVIPINKVVAKLIDEQKQEYSTYYGFNEDWYIFGGLKPYMDTAIRWQLDCAIKKAQLKSITTHDLRHSCASYYIHLNYPINLVAELLGDNINTVYKTYYHLYHKDLKEMIEKSV